MNQMIEDTVNMYLACQMMLQYKNICLAQSYLFILFIYLFI